MLNLHLHTTFSDGAFTPEEYVKTALNTQLKVIGFADHYYTTKVSNKCLLADELENYLNTINNLKRSYSKKLKILCGLEIDFCLLRTNFVTMPYHLLNNFDFLLFEYVEDKNYQGLNLEELIKLRPIFKCEVGLAHNDIERNFSKDKYLYLLNTLIENNIFLELCPSERQYRGNAPYYYYADEFFYLCANKKIKFSIGTDTHNNLQEIDKIFNAYDFLHNASLERNLIFL